MLQRANMCSVQILLFVLLLACGGWADQYKIVDTDNGKIRGIKSSTLLKGDPYYAFKGIPYAKPPIGDLRFKAPKPSEPWKPDILNAFQYSNICTQPGTILPQPSPPSAPQNEDCLFLNIFIPANVEPDEKMAVLFYIHGGVYIEGAGDDYFFGPDFIVEKQTILVTINYRLGIFGFLSLNSTEHSGNMGLKDQQLALKWIHSNIHQFGGDNNRITIFGESAGGASVNYQILSEESRKYFRNAIPMSGSVGNPWASPSEQDHVKNAFEIAEKLGKPQNSYDDLVKFFKTTPTDSLNQFSTTVVPNAVQISIVFGPTIEREDAKQPFLVDSPQKVYELSTISVNTMFTIASKEITSIVPKIPGAVLDMLNANFDSPLPFYAPIVSIKSDEARKNLSDQIRKFYFGDKAIDEQTLSNFLDLGTDFNFVWGIVQSATTLARYSMGKTFYTLFSFDSKLNVYKNLKVFKRDESFIQPGSSHGDELCYLFRCSMALSIYDEILNNKDDEQSKISLQTIENITKLFTNFAKYDEPSHENDFGEEFRPIDPDQINFIDFSNDGLKAGVNPHKEAIDFWTGLEHTARIFSHNEESNEGEALQILKQLR